MKIGLVSDSHGSPLAVKRALNALGPIDILVHLGDGDGDVEDPLIPFYQLKGNCDRGSFAVRETIIEPENGIRILLCHGDEWNVKWGMEKLMYHAMEAEVQAVCFGHTHSPMSKTENGILFLNPGSCRGYGASCARIDISDHVLFPTILEI